MSSTSVPPPAYSKPAEPIPEYTSAVSYYGLSLIKTEFLTPYHYNGGNRSWKPVLLEINSTQLKIYSLNVEKKLNELLVCLYFELNSLNQLTKDVNSQYKKNNGVSFSETLNNEDDLSDLFAGDAYGGFDSNKSILSDSSFTKLKNKLKNQKSNKTMQLIKNYYDELKDNQFLFEPTTSTEDYLKFANQYRGTLLHCYSLANLQVGEAPSLNQLISAMYKEEHNGNTNNSSLVKYKNTLRLRIEYKQVLLQFWSFYGMINWFRNFTIGKDLSLPIDFRHITQLKSIPARNTSRNNALLAATAAAANYGRHRHRHSSDAGDGADAAIEMFRASQMMQIKSEDSNTPSDDETTSVTSSMFDNDRRESIVSTTTSIDPVTHVVINDFKFYSQDSCYTTVEKQYISNCIPDLNSFDKWNGKLITLSNVDYFVGQKRQQFEAEDHIFISQGALNDMVMSYDRKPHRDTNDITTKTFIIQQHGLVGLCDDEMVATR
ncbi:hypothetical protein Cantr_10584 [Candida viswanathii]|uniref:Uncharacterized protein n=1 Tax=Candida viswanathii TaxID=5486 RepID=A0A367YDG1_9ASCO|nr:hypothetical protein Cantr_10584 [Candida viswanathii]